MNINETIDPTKIHTWLAHNTPIGDIEKELKSMGYEAAVVESIIENIEKERISKRQNKAFVILGIGAMIGFASFLLGIINPIPQLFNLVFYGLTSVAVLIIVVGLYFLFE